mmetsp:Transcript_79270/g.164556  ORF Transcript_79270/g.164556 Transcript_79270/m.164556 type:complete len:456 (+) Transcript_79270:224-1591(+)
MFRRLSDDGELDLGKSGLAFLLVIFAGASTGIGASVVFEQRFVRLASRKVLAAALAFSAGVMMYVTFIEIIPESRQKFEEAGLSEEQAYWVTTICFFLGIAGLRVLFAIVHCIDKNHDMFDEAPILDSPEPNNLGGRGSGDYPKTRLPAHSAQEHQPLAAEAPPQFSASAAVGPDMDPVAVGEVKDFGSPSEAQTARSKAPRSLAMVSGQQQPNSGSRRPCSHWMLNCLGLASAPCAPAPGPSSRNRQVSVGCLGAPVAAPIGNSLGKDEPSDVVQVDLEGLQSQQEVTSNPDGEVVEDAKQLRNVGMMTALAIAIHNLPEGLATYVGYLTDPSIGITMAFAIAIHNIPEGLCVALPIYYATGSRLRGFMFALLSGAAEPLGALLGFALLTVTGNNLHGAVYGVVFALIAGMMVMICILELIPTAYRYDPEDKVSTASLVGGMAVMALSLCLFKV